MAFTERLASDEVNNMYTKLISDIKNDNFESLDLMHHYASGFKAMFTSETHNRLEQIRQSLGGVGFSDFSGVNEIM